MKIALTKGEFEVVYQCVEQALFGQWDNSIGEQILKALFTKLYIKMYALAIVEKPCYKFKVEIELALAFLAKTKDNRLPYDSYEGNVINRLNAAIHKESIKQTSTNQHKLLIN